MDFDLSRQQEMLKSMVHEFAARELVPNAARWDDSGEFPMEIVPRIAELQLHGTNVEIKYGGNNLGNIATMLIAEELSWGYTPAAMYFANVNECAWLLQNFAPEEIRQNYIPSTCKGEKLTSFATTESNGGSDISGMQARAEDSDDGYVINGRKIFISFAEVADICLVSAVHNGKIDVFVVEKGTPGFEVTRREKMWGLRGDPLGELVFNNCQVPKGNMLGSEGSGMNILITALSKIARPTFGAIAVGLARSSFDTTLNFARERKLSGTAIGNFQAIQMMLADMDTEISAAKWLVYHCAWLLDQGKNSREVNKESAQVKLYTAEMANNICRKAVQIMGGYGVSLDYPVIRRFNDAVALIPAIGTLEISRIITARELLKA